MAAAHAAFNTHELVARVVVHLPMFDKYRVMRVAKIWKLVVTTHPEIKDSLALEPLNKTDPDRVEKLARAWKYWPGHLWEVLYDEDDLSCAVEFNQDLLASKSVLRPRYVDMHFGDRDVPGLLGVRQEACIHMVYDQAQHDSTWDTFITIPPVKSVQIAHPYPKEPDCGLLYPVARAEGCVLYVRGGVRMQDIFMAAQSLADSDRKYTNGWQERGPKLGEMSLDIALSRSGPRVGRE